MSKDVTLLDGDGRDEPTEHEIETAHNVPPAPRGSMTGGGGPVQFLRDVRLEMKRVSWPTRSEVAATTVVCLIAVAFFGLYLWGVDSLLTLFFLQLEGWLK